MGHRAIGVAAAALGNRAVILEFALAPAAGVHTIIAIHTRQDVAGTELMACW